MSGGAEKTGRDEAVAAARAWLALLDAGEYRACWENGAALMRGAVSPDRLAEVLRSTLAPMGAPVSRSLDGADHHETLPGAPDGRYWMMRFAASYERKRAAVETVTAAWDQGAGESGGAWRVIGYYIQ